MNKSHLATNVERFSGFEDLYHDARPTPPRMVIDVILGYLRSRPSLVVDLGAGTGLSTLIWRDEADRVMGIEPSDDMRERALRAREEMGSLSHVTFHKRYSHQLGLPSLSADVVTCSQSFHWMDPGPTLKEVGRVLKEGGIFAAYDCDWPPTVDWHIEEQYRSLMARADHIIQLTQPREDWVRRWDKNQHLAQLQRSQEFRFTKEVLFHHQETWTKARFFQLAMSQGGLQTVVQSNLADVSQEIAAFQETLDQYFDESQKTILLSYRMRLGIKLSQSQTKVH